MNGGGPDGPVAGDFGGLPFGTRARRCRSPGVLPGSKTVAFLQDFSNMELAGLEPATSWVQCIAKPHGGHHPGCESPVFRGDSASAPPVAGAPRGYACTRAVQRVRPDAPGADPVNHPALRGYAIQMMCFVIERVPRPAQHRRRIGRNPAEGDVGSAVLPANRRSRRQPPGRTRDSIPLSENHTPIQSPDSGTGPDCERRRPEPHSCGLLLRRRTCFLRRPDRPLPRYAGPPRDTGRRCDCHWRCSRPGGRLRATASVAKA